MSKTKINFLVLFLIFIGLINAHDFYYDFQEYGHSHVHLTIEALTILCSILGVSLLLREVYFRRRENENLQQELTNTQINLNQMSDNLRKVRSEYSKVIQEQLNEWELTPSEREVALLLLKGLSFEEIASVRETKEKTVRQQATAIYRKSGLNGRHAFAAWFFEDFLT